METNQLGNITYSSHTSFVLYIYYNVQKHPNNNQAMFVDKFSKQLTICKWSQVPEIIIYCISVFDVTNVKCTCTM